MIYSWFINHSLSFTVNLSYLSPKTVNMLNNWVLNHTLIIMSLLRSWGRSLLINVLSYRVLCSTRGEWVVLLASFKAGRVSDVHAAIYGLMMHGAQLTRPVFVYSLVRSLFSLPPTVPLLSSFLSLMFLFLSHSCWRPYCIVLYFRLTVLSVLFPCKAWCGDS